MTVLAAVPVQAPVVAVPIDGETVVYAPHTERLHRLDARASVVWQLLDGQTPLTVTVDDLATAYGTPRAVLEPDVLALVQELVDQGLVELD